MGALGFIGGPPSEGPPPVGTFGGLGAAGLLLPAAGVPESSKRASREANESPAAAAAGGLEPGGAILSWDWEAPLAAACWCARGVCVVRGWLPFG